MRTRYFLQRKQKCRCVIFQPEITYDLIYLLNVDIIEFSLKEKKFLNIRKNYTIDRTLIRVSAECI